MQIDKDEHFIKLFEENNHLTIHETAGQNSVQWVIKVDAHPKPILEWYYDHKKILTIIFKLKFHRINNVNQTIEPEDTRYEIKDDDTFTMLKIKNISLSDRGYYTLRAKNDFGEIETLQVFLNVTDKPTVKIQSNRFNLIDKPSHFTCTADAYPYATIRWFFRQCEDNSCEYEEVTNNFGVVAHAFNNQNYLRRSLLILTFNRRNWKIVARGKIQNSFRI